MYIFCVIVEERIHYGILQATCSDDAWEKVKCMFSHADSWDVKRVVDSSFQVEMME